MYTKAQRAGDNMKFKNTITIRKIEEKDKANYLRLFAEEDFGCVGMFSELKPSIYEEETTISKIIDKSIIDEEVLIIEDNNEFIGYASISRPSKHIYHIGEFVIRKDKQRQGYGSKLMNQIKKHAYSDNCKIKLECISSSTVFFEKQGFQHQWSSSYILENYHGFFPPREALFEDYSIIEEARETENCKQKRREKTLNPELIKKIMEL